MSRVYVHHLAREGRRMTDVVTIPDTTPVVICGTRWRRKTGGSFFRVAELRYHGDGNLYALGESEESGYVRWIRVNRFGRYYERAI